MKVLIGSIMHETNTFSNMLTDEESFKKWEWLVGDEIITVNRGVRNYLGGMIDEAEEAGFEIKASFSAYAYPAGVITSETYKKLKHSLLEEIRHANRYDAVLLSLHGAGVSEVTEDIEGELLREVRGIVGDHVPIVVTLDLHANVTEDMVNYSDLILGNHLYPHTDCYEIGREAVVRAKQIVTGDLKPSMHLVQLPMLVPTSTTGHSPAKEINEQCFRWEEQNDVIDCTFYHGFPYTNISSVGATVLVTTNDRPDMAAEIAQAVGNLIWKKRKEFIKKKPSQQEGIRLALEHQGMPVVLNETSDNPGGGTPGDGTHLLRALIESGESGICFGFIYDPDTVQQAIQSGIGTTIQATIGGKTDDLHGEPIEASAYVKTISDGLFTQSSPMGKGAKVNLGPSVRLQCGGVDMIICSVKAQTLDEEIFKLHGIDIRSYKIVGLKSSQHFRAGFEPISSRIITVDSPGLTTLDFTAFDYTKLEGEVYPLHEETVWSPGEISHAN